MGILSGLVVVGLLWVALPTGPAAASEPTPTPGLMDVAGPPDQPYNPLCSTALELSRASLNPPGIAADSSAPAVIFANPAVGARAVPTYSLVSVVFDRAMEAGSLNNDTFYVSQESGRVAGTIRYISEGNTAVFEPTAGLLSNTTYTATVTTGARSLAGESLPREVVWTFATFSGVFEAGGEAAAARVSPYGDGMYVYFGDLHSHTGYSDGAATPAVAFAMARANGLDFFATTDHDFMLNQAEWQDTLVQADLATQPGRFIALRGFEFTNFYGHINVFNTDTFVRGNAPAYLSFPDFYAWLANQPGAIAQFNHPLKENGLDWNFNNFAYNGVGDHKINLRELTNKTQFLLSLNKGWHLGTLRNTDTHQANWGCCRLMGLAAPALTKASILEALTAKRTFFVSPYDQNLAVLMKANGHWMGSAIPNTSQINFNIKVSDPDPTGSSLKLNLYDNGLKVASTTQPATTLYTWRPKVQAKLGHYYYVEAYYPGWVFAAYSSPTWLERPPLARAGAAQTVIAGDLVTLDGSQSQDPDDRPLLYAWNVKSGPAVTLNDANSAQPTFIAPQVDGDIVFRLTVTDVGGLTAVDETVVSVTTKPVLAITKSGPVTAEPDEPVEYILTVTNSGATTATQVVITDVVPAGATYFSGGMLLPDNKTVSWTWPSLAARGGTVQVSFMVTTTGSIANKNYQVSCAEGVSAVGTVVVLTNPTKTYLPVITKGYKP